jgi:TRAF3-interacting protein 1
MYTKLFQKPPMSEKLLSKPPFKYLFDVVVALKGATHFGEGLYTDQELDPNLYNVRNPIHQP